MPSALIVDESAPMGSVREQLSKHHPGLRIVGTAGSVALAIRFMKRARPDFVFLGWEMAGGLKAECLNFLTARSRVIFVSDFGSHAILPARPGWQDDPSGAGDWMLQSQPGFPSSFLLSGRKKSGSRVRGKSSALQAVRRVDSPDHTQIIPLEDVLWIEAAQNYSKVFFSGIGRDILFHRTMGAWENLLPSHAFLRISRSLIVKLTAIEKLNCSGRDETDVFFQGSDKQLKLGRTAALRLRSFFKCD